MGPSPADPAPAYLGGKLGPNFGPSWSISTVLWPILVRKRPKSGQCLGNPNHYNLCKKYGSTPPICTAVRPPFVSPYFPGIKLRRKGNPAVRPPFVLQYFWKNTGGWGHRNVSEKSARSRLLHKGLLSAPGRRGGGGLRLAVNQGHAFE